MTKSMIPSIVLILAMAVKIIFGIEISQDLQDQIVQAIAVVIAVVVAIHGVYIDHKVKAKSKQK